MGVGGRRRTRRTHKERKKDTVRHDKETDRYGRINVSGYHDYKERKKIPRHDKETDRYGRTNAIRTTRKERRKDSVRHDKETDR